MDQALPFVKGIIAWTHFDAVVTMNALDHGASNFNAIAKIADLLAPGGKHVHLRTPAQLNVGHDHCLTAEDLHQALACAGLRTEQETIYERDPIEGCAYRTVVGVYSKA